MTEKLSLLLDLDENDYQIVIDELSLTKKGVKFNYVIDLFDISEYCYPFGLKEEPYNNIQLKKHIDYVADEQYALYQLFNKQTEKIILFDEYLVELLYFKKFIKYAIENGVYLVNTLKKYEDEFYSEGALNTKQEKTLEELIQTKLTVILSYLIDFNNSGIQKLVSLFKDKKIVLDEDELTNSNDDEILKAVLLENRGSELTELILEKIWKNEPNFDTTFYNKNARYTARKRDAKVIDRIICINKDLRKRYKESKNNINQQVVLYLSSTQTSKEFFQKEFIHKNSIIINDIIVNPLRNKAQLFLKALCFNSEDIDESIANVTYLKKRILKIKSLKKLIPEEILRFDINTTLSNKFNYYREKFETYAILNQYQNISDLIDSTLKKIQNNKNSGFVTEIMPVLNKLITIGNAVEREKFDDLITLDNWENQVKYTYYTKKTIEKIINQQEIFRFNTGKDPIRSTIHHLPIIYRIVLNKDSENSNSFKEIIDKISLYIIEPFATFSPDEIKTLTTEAFNKTIELQPSLEERLVKALVLLLMPKNDEIEDTNQLAYDWTYSILQKEIYTYEKRDELKDIESDYIYFISWAARRCQDYTTAKEILNDAILKYSNDARFFHGLALVEYCILETDKTFDSNNKISGLESCLKNATRGQELYKKDDSYPVIYKTRIALYNTIAYFNAEIYFLKNDFSKNDQIKIARGNINSLKKSDSDYYKYPEYLHTEAFVELLEFKNILYLIKSEKDSEFTYTDAHYKIHCSLIAIIKSIDESLERGSHKSLEKYRELFEEIKDEKKKFEKEHPLT